MPVKVLIRYLAKRKRPHDESSAIGQTVHGTIDVQALNDIIDARYAAHQCRLEEMYSAHKREVEEVKRELKELKCELKNVISKEEAEELKKDLMNRMEGIDKSINDMPDTVEVSVLDTIFSTPLYFAR